MVKKLNKQNKKIWNIICLITLLLAVIGTLFCTTKGYLSDTSAVFNPIEDTAPINKLMQVGETQTDSLFFDMIQVNSISIESQYNNVDVKMYYMLNDSNDKLIQEGYAKYHDDIRVIEIDDLKLSDVQIDEEYKLTLENHSEGPVFIQTGENHEVEGTVEYPLVYSYFGKDIVYPTRYIVIGFIAFLASIVALFFLNKSFVLTNKKLDKIYKIIDKYCIAYVIEVVVFFLVILSLMNAVYDFYYLKELSVITVFAVILSEGIFLAYFLLLVFRSKKEIAKLFLILGIPLAMLYLFMVIPNGVPDEVTHFGKAYYMSTGHLENVSEFYLPKSYDGKTYYSYKFLYDNLFSHTDYSDVIKSTLIVSYNFVGYILPAFGIALGRFVGLSIYGAFYLGRFMNVIAFWIIGYYAIKRLPIAKMFMFIYLLSPMVLQQTASINIDSIVNVISLYAIAHILDLKFNDKKIMNIDIFILGSIFVILFLLKMNYLPIFGLLLMVPSLKKMTIKQWIHVALYIVTGVAIMYVVKHFLTFTSGEYSSSTAEYMAIMGVDVEKQTALVLSKPIYFMNVVMNTLVHTGEFYFNSFFGKALSWLNINVHWFVIYTYSILLISSLFVDQVKYKFKKIEKLWMFVICCVMVAAIFFALYTTWTGYSQDLILGVQGRYFIPIVFILLLLLRKTATLKIENVEYKYFMLLIVIHLYVCYYIFNGFI